MLRHDRERMNLVQFLVEFLFFFMILGYGSLKFTYFVAKQRFGEAEIQEQADRNRKIQTQIDKRFPDKERESYSRHAFGVVTGLSVMIFGILSCGISAYFDNPNYTPVIFKVSVFTGLIIGWMLSDKITKRKFDHKPIINIPDRTKSIFNVVGLSLYWEFYLLWIIVGVPRKFHSAITHNFDLWQLNMAIEIGLLLPLILIVCTQAYLKNKGAILIRIPLTVLALMPIVTDIVYEIGIYIAAH
jgi:hypothetical protein